jgi:hypothetical protein
MVFMTEDLSGARPPLAARQFRLFFPYVAGDLYGAPTTGDLSHPVVGPDYALQINLNRSHAGVLASLEPTDLHLSYLRIDPPQARIARLMPLMLQRDGIEAVGELVWLDPDSRQELFLLYVDRPASITGHTVVGGRSLRYDIRASAADYVWVRRQPNAAEVVYTVTPRPARLQLAVKPVGAVR